VTQLLKAMAHGDQRAAEDLLPLVYAELHRLARSYMRRERPPARERPAPGPTFSRTRSVQAT
jgi:hypothetical protein